MRMYLLSLFVSIVVIDGFQAGIPNLATRNFSFKRRFDLHDELEREDVTKGEFPHQIALYPQLPDEYISFCGGSILSETWILTAAHCCDDVSGFDVVAGGVSLQTNEGIEQPSSVSSNGIFIHEHYGEKGTNNDICLLKLNKPLEFNEFVGSIGLPQQNEKLNESTKLIMTGWGTTMGSPIHPDEIKLKFPFLDHMKKTTVPYMDTNTCTAAYTNWPPCQFFNICPVLTDICTGGDDSSKADCAGDTGGPLIDIEKKILIGVVSWGNKCASQEYPGVNVEVSGFVEWIENTIENNS